jgi:hypothetical protein
MITCFWSDDVRNLLLGISRTQSIKAGASEVHEARSFLAMQKRTGGQAMDGSTALSM